MGEQSSNSILEALLKRLEALEQENALLKAENERLKLELAAAKKNSRNSSKPPSSDIVKPPPKGGKGKRHIGGQPGHTPHFRQRFTSEQLDDVQIFDPPSLVCGCGGVLTPCPVSDLVQQQIELRDNPIIRREYRARAYRCSVCSAFHRESLPSHVVNEGFVGNRLTALLAFLNVKGHASYSALAAFMKDVCGEPVSRGQIAKSLRRVSNSLEAPYDEAVRRLCEEPVLNIDETGHRELGKRFWTWVFCAVNFVVFHIDKTRASGVLAAILGPEYQGTIGCDYYSAYHKYLGESGAAAQFCLAHLTRELRFLRECPDPATEKYAGRCLAAMKRLFKIHHRLRESGDDDRRELAAAGERLWRAIVDAPPDGKATNIAMRFLDTRDFYLSFVANPQIEPTNNGAERAIRQVVIDRAASQGTRGPNGRAYKERMWTVLATCARRGASAFEFIFDALYAHANATNHPSLVN